MGNEPIYLGHSKIFKLPFCLHFSRIFFLLSANSQVLKGKLTADFKFQDWAIFWSISSQNRKIGHLTSILSVDNFFSFWLVVLVKQSIIVHGNFLIFEIKLVFTDNFLVKRCNVRKILGEFVSMSTQVGKKLYSLNKMLCLF